MLVGFVSTVFRPVVRDSADVSRYVRAVTLFAWIVATTGSVTQEFLQGGGFWTYVFDQAMVLVVVFAVAIPVARSMGFAHLKLHHAQQEAERLSRTDPLTGLANRRAFYQAAVDLTGVAVALAIADIDRFKRINDRHGHAAGDAALTAVAHIMRDELSDLGVVARLGGEEFGLLSPKPEATRLRERLQRFRQRVAEAKLEFEGKAIEVTVSVGFDVRADANLDALYSAADRALYVAKSAGRDRVVAFEEIEAALGEGRVAQAS